jgi:acyl-CoA thioester hydrolase
VTSGNSDRPPSRNPSSWPAPIQSRFSISREFAVLWGDMDAMRNVNHTSYFRWIEELRMTYFSTVGLEFSPSAEPAPLLAATSTDFLRTIVWPDRVLGETKVIRLGRTSFTMSYRLSSMTQQAVAATGTAVIVLVSSTLGRPTPMSDDLRANIRRLDPDAKDQS